MKRIIYSLLVCLPIILGGCSYNKSAVHVKEPIRASREIIISGKDAPWIYDLANALRREGFIVSLMLEDNSRVITYLRGKKYLNKDFDMKKLPRYNLVVSGTVFDYCFGGGYHFSRIEAVLVDSDTGEVLSETVGRGYSEKCPPASTTLFADIAKNVNNIWASPYHAVTK